MKAQPPLEQTQPLEQIIDKIKAASDLPALEALRVSFLGRKGIVSDFYQELKALTGADRAKRGEEIGLWRSSVELALKDKKTTLEAAQMSRALKDETLDVTLPVGAAAGGKLHVIQQTIDEVVAIFGAMGFEVGEGPDIEDDFHNFEALNFPADHPARDMHDTFFLPPSPSDGAGPLDNANRVLRTHTSPVQIRSMLNKKPPLRVIAPGRCYRCDSDLTHTPMFHQVEGLLIDKTSSMANLRACLDRFIEEYFERSDVRTRFRPSFFPFTEPSAEIDVACRREKDRLIVGEGDDWLEILGCGMVHHNVIRKCGLDPDEWRGFAFGMGLERIAMLKYGIHDLRLFFESGQGWLRHYGFSPLFSSSTSTGLREPK